MSRVTLCLGWGMRRTRGSLRSSSCLVRKPPRAPQLEETPEMKLQYFGHFTRRVDSLEKTLMLGGIGGRSSHFICTCQPLYQQLSGAREAPISSLIINCQPHYQHVLAAGLESLEAAQGTPRAPRRDSRGERSPWLPLETRPDSPGDNVADSS